MAHLIKIPEAAALSGIPLSTMRKSFMREQPTHVPPPPPHKRIGRSIYILSDKLEAWVHGLDAPVKRGRPTKAEMIARRHTPSDQPR